MLPRVCTGGQAKEGGGSGERGGSKTWTENLSGFENAERRGTEMKRTTSPVFREEGYHVFRGAPAGLLVLADTVREKR